MLAWFDEGMHVIIDGIHVLLDPSSWFESRARCPDRARPVDIVLVTHAHGDHSNALSKHMKKTGKDQRVVEMPVIMHPATCELLWTRINRVIEMKRGERVRYKTLSISAHEAGHCLGSLQYKIQGTAESFVFTGDINTTGSMSNDTGEILSADVVAIEATAGNESMIAAPKEVTYVEIHDFLKSSLADGKRTAVLYGHSLGKVQELTKLIGFFNDIKARLSMDGRSYKCNRTYELYRGKFGIPYQEFDNGFLSDGKKNIVLQGMMQLKDGKKTLGTKCKLTAEPPSLIISAFPVDGIPFKNINVSSHDDYNGLLNYLNISRKNHGKEMHVLVFHGEHAKFTGKLNALGYAAHDVHESLFSTT